jgi:hypothetical protein
MRLMSLGLISVCMALLAPLASVSATSLKGYWRMDDPLEGMQAVLGVYRCSGGDTLCAKISAVVGTNVDRRAMLNSELLRDLKPQRDSTYKGKLKMPKGRLPALNTIIEPQDQDSLSFKACFLGQCRSGTLSRLY